ncbi:MAG: ABC transporter substrate-binding protein [Acutalibacteraceae bacterium]
MKSNRFVRILTQTMCLLLSFSMLVFAGGCSENPSDTSEYSEYESYITTVVDKNNSDSQSASGDNQSDSTNNQSGSNNSGSSGGSSTANLDNVETKGKTFTIVSSLLPDRDAKNMTLFEKLFYQRVSEVEKEYGVTIKVVNSMGGAADQVAPMIRAGKMVGNIVETQVRWLPALVSAGYINPWDNVSGVNINDPNLISGYTEVATIGGKHYGLQYMKPPEVRYCLIMNKNLLKSAGIDPNGIYSMIQNKTWNWDTFEQYAIKTTNTAKGIYGVGGNPEYMMEMLLNSNNAKLVTLDSKGKATPTYTSSNVKQALNFMNKLINTDKVYKTQSTMSSKTGFSTPDYNSEFVQGKCAFLFEDSWVINQNIRPKVKNFDYGMVMVPLGPSGTEYTSSSGHARVFYITSTNKELDFTAKIFNALMKAPSGYSGDQWWKDEIMLDYFQSGDTQSLDIYMKSLNSMTFDYGLGLDNVFDGFKNAAFGSIFWNSGKTTDAAIDSIAGTYDKTITDFFNK